MDTKDADDEARATVADLAATAALPTLPPLRTATFPYHPGDIILPGYRLTKRLGSGGFGEVWRADAPGGMGVAIKILANLGRREGGREYRALQTIKNIRHAHIVPLFGVWLKANDGRVLSEDELHEAEKRILSVMPATAATRDTDDAGQASLESLELIVAMGLGDQTLFDRLRESQRAGSRGLPPEELVVWMQQAALALDHFNSSSRRSAENATAVQHCDIKPQNMLLVGDVVQVCDFGLARAQGEVRATSNTMASLAYAAPEMVSPPYDPSPATDQYSLAISYIELRTGRLPYAELTPITILRAKLDGQLDLTALTPTEISVLKRAIDVDPKKRWQSCAEFVRALRSSVPRGVDSATLASPPLRSQNVLPPADGQVATRQLPDLGLAETRGRETAAFAPVVAPPRTAGSAEAGTRSKAGVVAAVAASGLALLAGAYAAFGPRTQPPSSSSTTPPGSASADGMSQSASRETAPAALLARAGDLERRGDFVASAQDYGVALADHPDKLAAVLWSLQTKAADAGTPADCVPLLERLEKLYAASPPPRVAGISRWDVVNSLAWYTATQPAADAAAGRKARILAEEALNLAGSDPLLRAQSLDTLAASVARAGDTAEALRRIDDAIGLVEDPVQRAEFEKRRDHYQRGLPWNDP